jgi:hypothetical protein
MSKEQRVERIFREKEGRHYKKPYTIYMTFIIRTIFNLIYDLKKSNRRFPHVLPVAIGSTIPI